MNPRQRIARLAGNLVVTAGAGAGKTTCLVDAYLALLTGQGEGGALLPEQVVAMTFTEKAAAELRGRIIAAAQQRLPRGAEPTARVLAQLEWAPVGTIHSICGTILREFGATRGLDPDFAILDAEEFAELLAEVVAERLRRGLAEGDPRLALLLAQYRPDGPGGLGAILAELHQSLATLGIPAGQAARATAQALAADQAGREGHWRELVRAAGELAAAQRGGMVKPKRAPLVAGFLAAWQRLAPASPEGPENGALAELAGLLKGNWYEVNDLKKAAQAAIEGLRAAWAARALAAPSQALFCLAEEVEAAVARELAQRGALSFDQLLLQAGRLLEEDSLVLAELRRRWRVVMVDEFQDVNPVQGRLIRRLAGLEPGEACPEPPPRLLLVGDRKQSIYAFRGAEVGLFNATLEEFGRQPGQVTALAENFRSRPCLVEFFNRRFAKVFAPGELAADAPEAVVSFLPADRQVPGREEDDPARPAVVVVRVAGPEEADAAAWRVREATVLADYLAFLQRERGLPPGDLVVLFKRLTQVGVYERALAQAGLAFHTVRGRGFFASQEVSDLYLALRTVLDPSDEVALAGFLRSPLVGLSDEALLALAFAGDGRHEGLAAALARGKPLPAWLEGEAGLWDRARELLAGLRPLAPRLRPAELLAALIDESGLLPVVMACPDGEQRAANLGKLIETARRGELGRDARGFTLGLGEKLAAPPPEPQAPLGGEAAPVVRLMTIHQAKGLQFPVVVLADLAAPTAGGFPGQAGLGPGGELALTWREPTSGERLEPPLRQRLARRETARQEAEAARLFYVACTRARDSLVFFLPQREKAKGRQPGPWLAWVRDQVLSDPLTRVVAGGELASARAEEPRPPAAAWPEGLPPEPGPLAERGAALAERCLAGAPRLDPAQLLVRESVSGLEEMLACPRRYFVSRVLGVDLAALAPAGGPGAAGAAGAAGAPGEEAGERVALGSLVHKILETVDLRDPDRPGALARALAPLGAPAAQGERALALAGQVFRSELGELLAQAGGAAWREQGFLLGLAATPESPALELKGEFDLVLPSAEGPLIVDYKVSERIEPAHYRDQLAFYALAFWRGQPEGAAPPRAALCHLTSGGAALSFFAFTPAELEEQAARARQAAARIARLSPQDRLADLPRPVVCVRGCVLARSGLCRRPGEATA